MSRWFRSATRPHQPPMTAAEEDQHLQHVEVALLQLLNDDVAGADRTLKEGDSAYHACGRGISSFIASMLGGEKELLKDAATILQEAETRTWEEMKRAQRDPTAFRSEIYPPGTEYLLCFSIAQLTNAICHVMSGSVTEAIKGFLKLRKAFLTLDEIMAIESKHLKAKLAGRRGSFSATSSRLSRPETKRAHSGFAKSPSHTSDKENSLHEKPVTGFSKELDDHLENESAVAEGDLSHTETNNLKTIMTRTQSRLLDVDPATVGIQTHTDIFIHSGVRLCYGMLLVIFSMIENPLFSKVLYIVGFKGDRERGTRYLWQASRFSNFNSAIAGLCLLGYYNGLVGFCDILPTDPAGDDDLAGYPRGRCEALLRDMRKRYPENRLWRMEEARSHAYNRNLDEAVKILARNTDSKMKQIAMLNIFELSLTSMYSHEYELCAKSFIQCLEVSSWSPCLYTYSVGVSYLELYRDLQYKDPESAKLYRSKAIEWIKKAPPLAGRQKVMGKELPFDTYIRRKVQKWEDRAKAWKVDMLDATGCSPVTEMMFLWNAMKKQSIEYLERSLVTIQWDRTKYPEKFKDDLDEQAIHAVLSACIIRNTGKHEEARSLLQKSVLSHERHEFKAPHFDDWTHPAALYEMAAVAWVEKDIGEADHKAKVLECEEWLDKVKDYPDTYVMDTRVSMKVTTSLMTVKRHKGIMGL